MIKLIASDLDGTLLNSQKQISKNMGKMLCELGKRDIHFVVASGRSRASILECCDGQPVATVSDNGGTAYSKEGELLFVGDFSLEKAEPVLELAKKTPYMHIVLVGVKNIYVQEDESEEHKAFADFFFNHKIQLVPDIIAMFALDRIVKISISTGPDGRNEKRGLELMEPFSKDFSLVLSGDGWVDLMRKDVTKGATFKRICDYYGISMEETAAFGDYLNDLDMLMQTPNSYAMANAHPKIKESCKEVTQYTNDEDGVVRELKKILNLSI